MQASSRQLCQDVCGAFDGLPLHEDYMSGTEEAAAYQHSLSSHNLNEFGFLPHDVPGRDPPASTDTHQQQHHVTPAPQAHTLKPQNRRKQRRSLQRGRPPKVIAMQQSVQHVSEPCTTSGGQPQQQDRPNLVAGSAALCRTRSHNDTGTAHAAAHQDLLKAAGESRILHQPCWTMLQPVLPCHCCSKHASFPCLHCLWYSAVL